jgi:hypothetical protein
MKPEFKRNLRRYIVIAALCAAIYALSGQVITRGWQVGWHIIHRNQLRLTRSQYTIPLRWIVSGQDTENATLVDAPLWARTTTGAFIFENGSPTKVPFETVVETHERLFSQSGQLIASRRLHTVSGEIACLEGRQSVQPLQFYVVECYGSSGMSALFVGDQRCVDAFYAILSSARPLGK